MNGAAMCEGASTIVRTHAVSQLAAPVRRLPSARLAGGRRALTFRTTRGFVAAVSPSESSPGRSSLCVRRRTHARGGGGVPHA